MTEPSQPGDPHGATPAYGLRRARAPGRAGPSRGQTPVVALIARMVVAATVLALCVVVVWWWAIGGKWLIVRTPSMGTYAPVGALLWDKPANIAHIHVGDVITFRTPSYSYNAAGLGHPNSSVTIPSQTYTHRVVAINPDGTVQTKGDLNQVPDPWRTDQRHLVGAVAAAWPGVGWLVKAFPLLLPGLVGWWVLTGLFASKRSRVPLRVVGVGLLLAIAIFIYQPLFGAQELSFLQVGPSRAEATYVGTGLMPMKLQSPGEPSVLFHTGEARSIVTHHFSQTGRYRVHVVPTVPWQTWPIIVALFLVPAIWSVIVGVEPPPPPPSRKKPREPRPAPGTPQLQPS